MTTKQLTNYILGVCSEEAKLQVNEWIATSDEHSIRFFELCEQLKENTSLLQGDEQKIAESEQQTFKVIAQANNESALQKLQRYSQYAAVVLAMSCVSLNTSSLLNNKDKVILTKHTHGK